MARITLNFEVEMDLDIPDELAAQMTAQDVCDSADLAVRTRGTAPVVLNNEVLPARCSWALHPRHDELPFEEGVVSLIVGDKFALIADALGVE